MDLTEVIQMFALSVVLLVMMSAAYHDVRSREVSNAHWMAMGAVSIAGSLIVSILSDGMRWEFVFVSISESLILLIILTGSVKTDILFGSVAFCLAAVSVFCGDALELCPCAIMALVLCPVYLLFYWLGIIRGGADVKCLIVLAMSVTEYPAMGLGLFSDVPDAVEVLFSPSLSVMLVGAVISMAGCSVYCLVRNHGTPVSGRFNGFMMNVNDVERSFVWPLERVVDGRIARCAIPADEDISAVCRELRDHGSEKVLVTPMVPFILPLAAALFMILFVGNPVFIL